MTNTVAQQRRPQTSGSRTSLTTGKDQISHSHANINQSFAGRQQRPSPKPPPLKPHPPRYNRHIYTSARVLTFSLQRKHDSDGSEDEAKKSKSEPTETPKSEKKAKKHKSEKAEAAEEVGVGLCLYYSGD